MKKIFAVVVNYRRQKDTIECLESLFRSKIKDKEFKVVLVENESRETEVKKFKQLFPALDVIENKQNCGFAKGNNIGIKYSLEHGADYLVLINNDAIVKKDSISKLIEVFKKNPDVGIVGPKIYFAEGFEYHKQRYNQKELGKVIWYAGGKVDWGNILGSHRGLDEVDKGQYNKAGTTEFVSGCCMAVKKELFKKIGYLAEEYFLYMEDLDFNIRSQKAGFKIYYQPDAIVWHKNLGTTKKSINEKQQYYYTRNRMIFGFKWGTLKTKLLLVKESIKFLIYGSKFQKKGIIDFYYGK
jgi:hypothetical protein